MPGPVSDTMPSLPDRMRALADTGHPRADELRKRAAALDASVGVNVGDGGFDVRKTLGAWARARRLWCECTGEPLI